jgi:hypothetical protein
VLQEPDDDDDDDSNGPTGSPLGYHRAGKLGSATLGLNCRLRTEHDTTFASIGANSSYANDAMFAPAPFPTMDEFLVVAEKAWQPRMDLAEISAGWVSRFVFPAVMEAGHEMGYEAMKAESATAAAQYGPKMLFFRQGVDSGDMGDMGELSRASTETKKGDAKDDETGEGTKKRASKTSANSEFVFADMFPRTAEQLCGGRFRWIQYSNNKVLRVCAGRGAGPKNRECLPGQVLRQWHREFNSFHELMCAVEASWVRRVDGGGVVARVGGWGTTEGEGGGVEYIGDTPIPVFDADLGPSLPLPPEPPALGRSTEAVVVRGRVKGLRKQVMSMALCSRTNLGADGRNKEEKGGGDEEGEEEEEEEEAPWLFCGHADGTITKWDLSCNKMLWSIEAHAVREVHNRSGVAGLAVRYGGTDARVYSWAQDHTSGDGGGDYSEDGDDSGSLVKVWSGDTGAALRTLTPQLGEMAPCTERGEDGEMEEHDDTRRPLVSCVVFCRVPRVTGSVQDDTRRILQREDVVMVGYYAIGNTLYDYEEGDIDFEDFDVETVEHARDAGEGNIQPFCERTGDARETWCGSFTPPLAMAVVPDKFLVSCHIHMMVRGEPHILLWDLSVHNPGVLLSKVNVSHFTGDGFVGMAVRGSQLLCGVQYGDEIAILDLPAGGDDDGAGERFTEPILRGYASIGGRAYEDSSFNGCMTSFGNVAALTNEGETDIWLFPIRIDETCGTAGTTAGDAWSGHSSTTGKSRVQMLSKEPICRRDFGCDEDAELQAKRVARDMAAGKVGFPRSDISKAKKKESFMHAIPTGGVVVVGQDGGGAGGGGGDDDDDDDEYDVEAAKGYLYDHYGDAESQGCATRVAMRGRWLVAGYANGTILRSPLLPAANFAITPGDPEREGGNERSSCGLMSRRGGITSNRAPPQLVNEVLGNQNDCVLQ